MALHDNFELANQRAEKRQAAIPRAVSAHYDRKSGRVVISLSSKLEVSFSPDEAQGLGNAKPSATRENRDQPIRLRDSFSEDRRRPLPAGLVGGLSRLKKWMASRLGQVGGLSRSSGQESGFTDEWEGLAEDRKAVSIGSDGDPCDRAKGRPLESRRHNRALAKLSPQVSTGD